MLIKAAINGGRTKAEHPSVPVSPQEQALAVLECLAAGAGAVHLHVRSSTGEESLAAEDAARTLRAIRSATPEAQVGVSTGAWIVPHPEKRVEMVAAWTELPDFASVNFIEEGAVELAQLLLQRKIGVEAGLSDAQAADVFVRSGLAARCLRVLLEPQEQEIEKARKTVEEIEAALDDAGIDLPRLLHGTEATTWYVMEDAIMCGYDIRIGFEDTLRLPDGTVAQSNAELLAEAVRRVKRGGAV